MHGMSVEVQAFDIESNLVGSNSSEEISYRRSSDHRFKPKHCL